MVGIGANAARHEHSATKYNYVSVCRRVERYSWARSLETSPNLGNILFYQQHVYILDYKYRIIKNKMWSPSEIEMYIVTFTYTKLPIIKLEKYKTFIF